VSIFSLIREWADQRGIYAKGDSKTQYIKLQEESGELAKALLKNDRIEIVDAIGDMIVVLTNLAALEGLKVEDCIYSAYNVIKERQGKMVNGTFVKDGHTVVTTSPIYNSGFTGYMQNATYASSKGILNKHVQSTL
jgi:NTP pyrophosphatase (non-canonical NTP hydrolase)